MPELTVMTVNVRQPDQDDGANCWEHRRELLLETILGAAPDLIGTQETFRLQADWLAPRMPGFAWFGAGRLGDARDKHVAIFYRRDRLRLLDHGDFWLSTTPEVAGSSSWEIIRPRQVTWGRFETAGGARFHHFNTHFPYRKVEQEARREAAKLILRRAAGLGPALVTGDFNSPAGGEIHSSMAAYFEDAWATAGRRRGPEGTFHGFGAVEERGRIDWILHRGGWRVLEAATLDAARDGIYPSDHYPVTAQLVPTFGSEGDR